MKIKTTLNFSIPEVRRSLVKLLAESFPHFSEVEAYCPNEGDETFWTIDEGNDWKVAFFYQYGENDTFEIRYRYSEERAERFMRGWVENNGGEIV